MAVARLLTEDEPMLRGDATFTADLAVLADTLHAVFVRSTEAHGLLLEVDVSEAIDRPGVVAVLLAEDLGLAPHSYYPTTLGGAMARPLLATDRVRFVGEPLAVVLADSPGAAHDAAEQVVVEIEPLPVEVDPEQAASSPNLLFPEAKTNVVVPLAEPDPNDADPLTGSVVVGEVRSVSPRLTSVPIEPCAIAAKPTAGGGLDVVCTGQGVHRQHDTLVEVLGLARDQVRVRHPQVGGGFGGRGDALPEFLVVAAASLRLQRPVRWVQQRYEQFVSMPYGRGQAYRFRVGLDEDGLLVGVDAEMWCDVGAYPHMASVLAMASRRQCTGMYRIPAFRFRFGAAVTNTPPVGAYRGAGQPEVNLALERAIDAAARVAGLDPIEVRRRNLLRPSELPYETGTGIAIDTGDPAAALDAALAAVDASLWRAVQDERRATNSPLEIGIGVGCYSQTAGSGEGPDFAELELQSDGSVLVNCASASHGQGHHSLWAQLVEQRLGVAAGRVKVVDADSSAAPHGQTTGGSRTSFVLGAQIAAGAEALYEQVRLVAADLLEAHPDDLVVGADGWSVAGVPSRLVSWADVAAASSSGDGSRAANAGVGAHRVVADVRIGGPTHPYGAHASVVEVDVETGLVRLLAHAAVDDCGVVLDEASVEGQQHGGAVSGIAPALWEAAAWDDDGTPRTASLLDYLLPTAAELPPIVTVRPEIPTIRNPLGVRGIGENGAIAAPPAVLNAVVDALHHRGVTELQIPVSPEQVWAALRDADPVAR